MGSEDYGVGGMPGDENSSLAARRARLRGSLSKSASPPDPYTPDPYLAAATATGLATQPSTTNGGDDHQESGNGKNGSSSAILSSAIAPDTVASLEESIEQAAREAEIPEPAAESSKSDRRKQQAAPVPVPVMANLSDVVANSVEQFSQLLDQKKSPAAADDQVVTPVASPGAVSLKQPTFDPIPEPPAVSAAPAPQAEPTPVAAQTTTSPPVVVPAVSAKSTDVVVGNGSYGLQPTSDAVQPFSTLMPPPHLQAHAFEVLNNIDSAMGACAHNLSSLQKMAGEQTEALRGLAQSLQNQSFFEIGLNLNTLMESLSAALEPMKAVGELVPAIDQLVSVIEARETAAAEEPVKLTRDQLVTNLADQLSAGVIDPWTFKCAYIAVYPTDHPADLLHRLVDLLGTQRLSGELFRAAYDAVQAAEPVKTAAGEEATRTVVKVVQDETLLAQIEALQEANDEFRQKQGAIQTMLKDKEAEFTKHVSEKEKELQEAQELLNSRYEEFNTRYDELTGELNKRDEVLHEKDAEIVRKESENNQLRAQMEELREQTKEMLADLQKMSNKPKEEPVQQQQPQQQAVSQPAPKPNGFFDQVPNPQTPQQMFDPARQAPQQTPQQQQPAPTMQLPQPQQPQMQQPQMQQPQMQQPQMQQPQQQMQQPLPTNQAVPKAPAPTTPFAGAAGSYGSGVRAQVFEVIVRQALAGAPWREICAGPMQVNNISPEEVEAEVKRRQALLKK